MASARPTPHRRRLGQLLLEAALVTEDQLRTALVEQRRWGSRLGRTVVQLGFISETALAAVLAAQLDLPTIDLDAAALPPRVIDHLRLDLAERYGVFPLGADGGSLFLATSDPTNHEHLQELAFATAQRLRIAVTTASSIDRAIRKYYFGDAGTPAPATARTPPPVPHTPPPIAPPPAPSARSAAAPDPGPPTTGATEQALRAEIDLLREQIDSLEATSASQLRALRGLVELLVEAGLISREEYLERLNAKDG